MEGGALVLFYLDGGHCVAELHPVIAKHCGLGRYGEISRGHAVGICADAHGIDHSSVHILECEHTFSVLSHFHLVAILGINHHCRMDGLTWTVDGAVGENLINSPEVCVRFVFIHAQPIFHLQRLVFRRSESLESMVGEVFVAWVLEIGYAVGVGYGRLCLRLIAFSAPTVLP